MLLVLCDDEPLELNTIQQTLLLAAAELSVEIRIAAYSSGEALLRAVQNGMRPALAILDIFMDGADGVEIARSLRETIPGLPLAFLTTSRDYAVDAFALDAVHYLLKPVTPEKTRLLLNRFQLRCHQPPLVLTLVSGRASRQFPLRKILYITSFDRGVMVFLEEHTRGQWFACPFHTALEQLSENPDFLQISRGCIVNLCAVRYIGREACHMKNGERLSISRRERRKTQQCYHEFLFRQLKQAKEDML